MSGQPVAGIATDMAAPWKPDIYLAQADKNLWQMSDMAFTAMPRQARLVEVADYAYAAKVLDAFSAPDPTSLNRLTGMPVPLPWLQVPIQRQLVEYPDALSGFAAIIDDSVTAPGVRYAVSEWAVRPDAAGRSSGVHG